MTAFRVAKYATIKLALLFTIQAASPAIVYAPYNAPGLRYYREAYPGTFCSQGPDGLIECIVQGDYHAGDIFFPNPKWMWL